MDAWPQNHGMISSVDYLCDTKAIILGGTVHFPALQIYGSEFHAYT